MKVTELDPIARLNAMSPRELEAERARSSARLEAAFNRQPYAEDRADAVPLVQAVVHRDGVGRAITEYRGEPGAMRSWMEPWMTPANLQIGVYVGSTPKQEKEFRQRMQRKLAMYDRAFAQHAGG